MNNEWKNIIATKITFALHVPASGGKDFHQNRPTHGLILNDPIANKDYVFSDGQVLHTEGDELFYLPRGSTYNVKTYEGGSCYALNFDAEFSDKPFVMRLRNAEALRKIFRNAGKSWKSNSPTRELEAMRALYEIILTMISEQERNYLPNKNAEKLEPAIKKIEERFSDNNLSVSELASLCGMSGVYFRKLFEDRFGISPKKYLIQIRMEYAKSLLETEQFTITKVAELCGYTEPCHFSREFSKYFGVPPSAYLGTSIMT